MYGWIGVDLDGTLATYTKFTTILDIGDPITPMVDRVKAWIEQGYEVRIFTARVGLSRWVIDKETGAHVPMEAVYETIQDWTEKHIGKRLTVTCVKDMHMIELYDDRCVQVEANTGRLIGESTRVYTNVTKDT